MKYATLILFCAVALTIGATTRSFAQPRTATPVQETDDEYKVTTYKKFVDNREPYPAVAYQAARDYMAKYGKEDDQYTRYLRTWISAYEEDLRNLRLAAEKADREQQLLGSFTQKDFAKAYGMAKQVLADDPENLKVLIALGYEGVLASETRNESFNADAATYARKAIQQIDAGKAPADWAPFKGKDDTLAYLHYAVGFLTLKTDPNQAIDSNPSRRETIYLLKDGDSIPLIARGGVPSLEKSVGDPEVGAIAAWVDTPADARWTHVDPAGVLRTFDRFHSQPDVPEFAGSWAEWLWRSLPRRQSRSPRARRGAAGLRRSLSLRPSATPCRVRRSTA